MGRSRQTVTFRTQTRNYPQPERGPIRAVAATISAGHPEVPCNHADRRVGEQIRLSTAEQPCP
jgi:hypothetical protein